MEITNTYDNLESYSRLISCFAGNKDYAIANDGYFEVDGKCSFYRLGIDESGSLYKGQFYNGEVYWYPISSVKEAWSPRN